MAKKLKDILGNIYRVRYEAGEEELKGKYWKILCSDFLQKYVSEKDSVLDVAAGHCEFINNIKAAKKYALDLDSRIKRYANPDVKVIIADASGMPENLTGTIDTVFMGCFLEHLPSKDDVISVFENIKRILKPGGRLLILNPNIRFSTSDYWDYFDHLLPVSDRSIAEVLRALDYEIEFILPKFVPNTIKDRLPKPPILVKIYLHLPILYPVFGRQMFIVARK